MTRRRVLTAREQAQMLRPWLEVTGGYVEDEDGRLLHRGLPGDELGDPEYAADLEAQGEPEGNGDWEWVEGLRAFRHRGTGEVVKPGGRTAGLFGDDEGTAVEDELAAREVARWGTPERALAELRNAVGRGEPYPDDEGSWEDVARGLGRMGAVMPPLENSQRTQIPGTYPTYEKAHRLLDGLGAGKRALDYGAGLGMSAQLGFDTYEPYPQKQFAPTYRRAEDVPAGAYDRVTSLNVLNVVPPDVRRGIVEGIGRALAPGGKAVITTRGRDVLKAHGEPGDEPMSVVTSRGTYQKGFTRRELTDYVQQVLGAGYRVEPVGLGPAGVVVHREA